MATVAAVETAEEKGETNDRSNLKDPSVLGGMKPTVKIRTILGGSVGGKSPAEAAWGGPAQSPLTGDSLLGIFLSHYLATNQRLFGITQCAG